MKEWRGGLSTLCTVLVSLSRALTPSTTTMLNLLSKKSGKTYVGLRPTSHTDKTLNDIAPIFFTVKYIALSIYRV